MSEATDRPTGAETDADAWADACAEDLAAERARRRAEQGPQDTGTAAQELFRLFEAVADKVQSLNAPLLGVAAQGAVQQLVDQAKSAAKPVIDRNPEVFGHLAAAGGELLAAYRSAVDAHEQRWTRGADTPTSTQAPLDPDGPEGEDPPSSQRIDLD
ncbi:DUF5304 family protein [Streptomyces sp. NPDC006879]|uniref:DUF5304 family protein n=1 Tax=Streptomyces sp. NPDC006879 TaxID=3364767 RepID=UPI0036888B16